MNKFIAFCGLDCETCEARIATMNNDDALKEKIAAEWSKLNNVLITKEMINCDGCRLNGNKTPYCESICPVRQCALIKNINSCKECTRLEACSKVQMIIANNPDALHRLKKQINR